MTELRGPSRTFSQWSDGPRQFKSSLVIGSAVPHMQEFNINAMSFDYGATSHWKGPWGRCIGLINGLVTEAARKRRLDAISQVVDVCVQWAENEARLHPSSARYIFKEWLPKPRLEYTWRWLKCASLFGLDGSMSWTMTRKCTERARRGRLTGVGANCNVLTGITVRNHGLTGLPGTAARTGNPQFVVDREDRLEKVKVVAVAADADGFSEEDVAEPAEEPPVPREEPSRMTWTTKSWHGWRTSFATATDAQSAEAQAPPQPPGGCHAANCRARPSRHAPSGQLSSAGCTCCQLCAQACTQSRGTRSPQRSCAVRATSQAWPAADPPSARRRSEQQQCLRCMMHA